MVKLAIPDSASCSFENVAWAALEKVSQKQKDADQLPEGSQHSVNLTITGAVDGTPFESSFSSVLSIGHRQTKSSSVNPQVPELVAWILGKLNRATRNRILLDLPEEFASNDNLIPKSNDVLVHESEQLLRKLRRQKTVEARGAVRCEYSI